MDTVRKYDFSQIRPYRPEDRKAVEAICIATGLHGRLHQLFCDPSLFAQLWLSAYLDGEPENTVVVEQDGKVAGYMVMSLRSGFEARALRCLLPHIAVMVRRLLSGKYRHHPNSQTFAKWILRRSWREHPRVPTHSAHFHFNLAENIRGKERGRELMAYFEDRVQAAGLKHWHGILFASAERHSLKVYERLGLEIFDARPCSLFQFEQCICYIKRFE